MYGYIMLCLILATSSVLRRMQEENLVHPHENHTMGNIYISCTLEPLESGLLYTMIYPPFCLHSNATILQVLSLFVTRMAPMEQGTVGIL